MAREYDIADSEWLYRDVGCSDGLYKSCLNCPLVKCRYDDPGWHLRANIDRDKRIVAAREAGAPYDVLAEEYDLSKRQIIRIVVAARKSAPLVTVPPATVSRKVGKPVERVIYLWKRGQLAFAWEFTPKGCQQMLVAA